MVMKTIQLLIVVGLLAGCVAPESKGAQAVLMVTNTQQGVTVIYRTNYPKVILKDFDSSQFYSLDQILGIKSGATVTNFVAVGSGDQSTQVGLSANASGFRSLAYGVGAQANDTAAIAVGDASSASGNSAVAMGSSSQAPFLESVALGPLSITSAANQIRLGKSSSGVYIPGTFETLGDATNRGNWYFPNLGTQKVVMIDGAGKLNVTTVSAGSTPTFDPNQFGGAAGGTNIIDGVPLTNAALKSFTSTGKANMKGDTVITNLVAWTNIVTATGNTTVTTNTHYYLGNPSGGTTNLVFTLPSAATCPGWWATFKRISSGLTNWVTVTNSSSQTIDGLTAWRMLGYNDYVTIVSDGSNWQVTQQSPAAGFAGMGWARGDSTTSAGTIFAMPPLTGTIGTGTAITSNLLRAFPIYLGQTTTITELATPITTGGANSIMYIGLAEDENGYPGRVILDAGNVATTGSSVIVACSNNCPFTVQGPAMYWILTAWQNVCTPLGTPVASAPSIGQNNAYSTASVFGYSYAYNVAIAPNMPTYYTNTGASRVTAAPIIKHYIQRSK
jgi:hypothetical protein